MKIFRNCQVNKILKSESCGLEAFDSSTVFCAFHDELVDKVIYENGYRHRTKKKPKGDKND